MVTGRTIISLVASRNWPLAKMDVNNAFHERDLYRLGLMDPPQGFHSLGNIKRAGYSISL